MPTYRYRCGDCGEEFELWQSITDEPLVTHEGACGGPVLKVFTPAGIVLKGSGFYKTDNRGKRSGERAPARESSGDTKSDGASGAGSSDGSGRSGGSGDSGDSRDSGGSSKPETQKGKPDSSKGKPESPKGKAVSSTG